MESPTTDLASGTEIVQAVVPRSLGDKIRADAEEDGRIQSRRPSVSNVIARILAAHYAKKPAKRRTKARA